MRVSFVGRVATNHTAFIRIKASQPAPNQELLILPVEVEVTTGKHPLLYTVRAANFFFSGKEKITPESAFFFLTSIKK